MKIPEQLWPVLLAVIGGLLEYAVLHANAPEVTKHDVAMGALALISAAAGALSRGVGSTSNVTAPNSTINAATGPAATFPETTK